MGTPNFKERREHIARAVKGHLLSGTVSRLARFLHKGGKQEKCVKHFCLGIYMELRNTFVHDWGHNDPQGNLDMIQRELARAWDTVQDPEGIESAEFRTFSSPPELKGLYEPSISGRSDLAVPTDVVTAMQHMTNSSLRIDTECWELFSEYRGWLYANGLQDIAERDDKPFTLHEDNDEAERFTRYHEKVETDRIADHREFNIAYGTADEVCRIYGVFGYGPTYSKRLRACTRFAEARPLSQDLEQRWVQKLESEHGCSLRFSSMDAWAEACATLEHLKASADYEEVGAAFAWRFYRKTNTCNAMVEIDAPASGYGHILAEQGIRGDNLERWINMNHHNYCHPYTAFTHDLMRKANIGLRVVPSGMSRDEFIKKIVKQVAKPAMVPGQYGSGPIPMAASAMGMDYSYEKGTGRLIWDFKFRWVDKDGNTYNEWEAKASPKGDGTGVLREEPKEPVKWIQTAFPEVPSLFASRFEGKSDNDICEGMVPLFKKVSVSLKRVFPELTKLNERSIEEWKNSVGASCLGLPPMVSNVGYEFQPTPFRIARGEFKRLQYALEGGERVELRHIQKYDLADNGTNYLAKRIQAKDATTKRRQYVHLAPTGVPSIGVHDADLFPVWGWDAVHDSYVKGVEDTHDLKISDNSLLLR